MRLAFVAGPPGSGKTSLLLHALARVRGEGLAAGVFKLDAVATTDEDLYRRRGFPVACRVAGDVCPDHEAMVSLGGAWEWAREQRLDLLAIETAGLCDRCSPFLARALAVCVVSGLSSLNAPDKMRTMVRSADMIVLARAESVSPAERQVMTARLRAINPTATLLVANGLTGEGSHVLAARLASLPPVRLLDQEPLRSVLPTGYCHFCQGTESGHG
jgi:Ni2+-binding GTPase involved in maturation of urease and hydrogenase